MKLQHLNTVVTERRQQRRLQAAMYGSSADPSVTIEARALHALIIAIDALQKWVERFGTDRTDGIITVYEDIVKSRAVEVGIYIDKIEYDS